MNIQLIILAAGNSSRLGSPKQLIDWQGKPLLRYVTEEALACRSSLATCEVSVILGAYAEEIRMALEGLPVETLLNTEWAEGQAASIRMAAEHAQAKQADALLILLSDQPYVTHELFEELISTYIPYSACVVVSNYGIDWGVPVLIDNSYFPELLKLRNDQGAKRIFNQMPEKLRHVPFKLGKVDVDTQEDVFQLAKRSFLD